MEAVVLIGIQGSGKSTFYVRRFFDTHVRISLDLLRTRHRENIFLRACIEGKQRFVVDNTNPTPESRAKYIALARAAGFRVIGYFFDTPLAEALQRNLSRPPGQQVPERGVRGTARRLAPPTPEEGFDELHRVRVLDTGEFAVTGDWRADAPSE